MCPLSPCRRAWKMYVAMALGVAVVLMAALSAMLCQLAVSSAMVGNSSVELAQLEKVLAITNRSLAEARGQWDGCRKQLVGAGVLLVGGGPGPRGETCSPQPRTACTWLV